MAVFENPNGFSEFIVTVDPYEVAVGENIYGTLSEAIAKVGNGETITLLSDVELSSGISFAKDITFTLDGNGHTIKPASGSTETNSAFNWGMGSDVTKATRNYTIKNVVFDGWTTDHVVRLQGVTAVVENCTFQNCNQPDGLGLLTLTMTDATVTGCTFKNNTCLKAIDVNSWGDGSISKTKIENCKFDKNTCTDTAVIYYAVGGGCTLTGNTFNENTINTSGHGATVYFSEGENCAVTNNVFTDNMVTATGVRAAGALVLEAGTTVSENVFSGNTATSSAESPCVAQVLYKADADAAPIDLNKNYWGNGGQPGANDYASVKGAPITLETYYTSYVNGTLGGLYDPSAPAPEDPTPDTPSSSSSSKPKYSVSVNTDKTEKGSVKLSTTNAKKGSTVTITVTPDAGYELDKLVVLDKDGNKVELTDKGNGKFTFKMPRGGVEVDASFVLKADAPAKDKKALVLTIGQPVYTVDGQPAVNDVAPIIKGERTMLPIKLIAENLGAKVSWSEADQSVTIVNGDTTIVIYIGQAFATVNGNPIQLDAPAFIANDRTYLPVRFVAENLGANVSWDAVTQTVTIIG